MSSHPPALKPLKCCKVKGRKFGLEPRDMQYSVRQILRKLSDLWQTMIECTFNKPGIHLKHFKNAPHRIWMHRVITARITWDKRASCPTFLGDSHEETSCRNRDWLYQPPGIKCK